jgi:hypothetical protein
MLQFESSNLYDYLCSLREQRHHLLVNGIEAFTQFVEAHR